MATFTNSTHAGSVFLAHSLASALSSPSSVDAPAAVRALNARPGAMPILRPDESDYYLAEELETWIADGSLEALKVAEDCLEMAVTFWFRKRYMARVKMLRKLISSRR